MIITIKPNTDLNKEVELINESESISNKSVDELKFDDIIYDCLPPILKDIFPLIAKPQNRDMALLSMLSILSNVTRKLVVLYGGKEENSQLFFYIIGESSLGKGYAGKFRAIGLKYHQYLEQQYLMRLDALEEVKEKEGIRREVFFLSGDITKAALSKELANNGGYGVFFVTEGDTLASSIKGEHGNFTEIVRIGFHSEHISVNKMYLDKPIEIEKVMLSILITSTPNQVLKVIPNFEDGTASRFGYYFLKPEPVFHDPYNNENYDAIEHEIDRISNYVLDIAVSQNDLNKLEFELSDAQKRISNKYFTELTDEFHENNPALIPNSFRFSLIMNRIAMIFTYLRMWKLIKQRKIDKLICIDTDFNSAFQIIKKLVQHLYLVENLYKTRRKNHNLQSSFNVSVNKNVEKITEALRLNQNGLKPTAISIEIFGNDKHKGTISKWLKKYKEAGFLFPETETTAIVNADEMLKETSVSVFKNAYESTLLTKRNLHSILTRNPNDFQKVLSASNLINLNAKIHACEQLSHFTAYGVIEERAYTSFSGFLGVLIKKEDNQHISNFDSLKTQFSNIRNVACCAKTLIDDYILLIPISNPSLADEYLKAIAEVFDKRGILIRNAVADFIFPVPYDKLPYFSKSCIVHKTTLIDY